MALALVIAPAIVHADALCSSNDPAQLARCGVSKTGSQTQCEDSEGKLTTDPEQCVNSTTRQVIDILSLVAGIIAVIVLIVGGLRYITSSGDSNKTSSARSTIIYALVGLVIIAFAQIIVRFVLSKL